MLDNPSGITEELTQDLDTLCLSESNFEVDPSQILRETADKHKLKFNLIQWLAESPNRTLKSQRKQAIAPNLSKISDLPEIFPAVQDLRIDATHSRGARPCAPTDGGSKVDLRKS